MAWIRACGGSSSNLPINVLYENGVSRLTWETRYNATFTYNYNYNGKFALRFFNSNASDGKVITNPIIDCSGYSRLHIKVAEVKASAQGIVKLRGGVSTDTSAFKTYFDGVSGVVTDDEVIVDVSNFDTYCLSWYLRANTGYVEVVVTKMWLE